MSMGGLLASIHLEWQNCVFSGRPQAAWFVGRYSWSMTRLLCDESLEKNYSSPTIACRIMSYSLAKLSMIYLGLVFKIRGGKLRYHLVTVT